MLVIVGYGASHHIGAMFANGARALGVEVDLVDVTEASSRYGIQNTLAFRLFDKSFPRQRSFEKTLLSYCAEARPKLLLATGLVPPSQATITKIRRLGVLCANYLTDDPFNPARRSKWFLKSLTSYDFLFSPRRANLSDLMALNGPKVHYLAFAFDPAVHFAEAAPANVISNYECDILFYGGADKDRFPYITALINAGLRVHLYGNYWQKNSTTKPFHKGVVTGKQLRWAVSTAKVNLCLVRRANRDDHVMRTFELAAMGACILAERTDDHLELFGDEFECAAYFDNENDLIDKAKFLLEHPTCRTQMAQNVRNKVATYQQTYANRLQQILCLTGVY